MERAPRQTTAGKKNWLFIGESEAGQRRSVLFTIVEASRSHGINPQSYRPDVLIRLPTMTIRQIKDVTPAASGEMWAGSDIEFLAEVVWGEKITRRVLSHDRHPWVFGPPELHQRVKGTVSHATAMKRVVGYLPYLKRLSIAA